jgi:glycyl-tRNA synthetase beta chain
MMPTGSKDPFALRRAALGIIRILAAGKIRLKVQTLCVYADAGEGTDALKEFLVERLRYFLREVKSFRYDEVNAILAVWADDPYEALVWAEALARVRPTPDFEPLATSFKRMKNILTQAGGLEKFPPDSFKNTSLEDDAEIKLWHEFKGVASKAQNSKATKEYAEALATIASLRPAVDLFFDKVLVMADQEEVRNNRLALLAHILSEFSTIADFAEIVSA